MPGRIDDRVRERLQVLVEEQTAVHGLELVEMELVEQRRAAKLVVTVDHPQGIGVDTCASLSRDISRALESQEDLAETFALEVGSPGLTRPLVKPADYSRFQGRLAVVAFKRPVNGKRRLRGLLAGYDAREDVIRMEELDTSHILEFPRSAVARARLDFDFPAGGQPGSPKQRGEAERGRP